MAIRYLNNKRHTVDILITSNSGNIVIAGNNTVSNIALPGQVLVGASIRQFFASSPSGNSAYWEIKRDVNVVCTPDSTTFFDFAGVGMGMNIDSTANLVCDLFRAADDEGSLWIQLHKDFDVPDDSNY